MILINERLRASLSFVRKCHALADIGSDHGYASIYAIENGLAEKVIATDISKPSLAKTERLVMEYNLSDKIECRCGDGLKVLKKGEADVIFAAGMGADLLADIVLQSQDVAKEAESIILQPMNNAAPLRKRLSEAGYSVFDEAIVFENGKVYQTLDIKFGCGKTLSPDELELGTFVYSRRIPNCRQYIEYMIENCKKIIRYAGAGDTETARAKICEANEKIERYGRALEWASAE